jgi:hypothetical protein
MNQIPAKIDWSGEEPIVLTDEQVDAAVAIPEIPEETIRKAVDGLLHKYGFLRRDVSKAYLDAMRNNVLAVLEAIDYPRKLRDFELAQRTADVEGQKIAELDADNRRLRKQLEKYDAMEAERTTGEFPTW